MGKDLEYEYDALEKGNAINRLLENEDFKTLFIEGFLKDDLIYLGLNMVNVQSDKRISLQEQLVSRGIVKQYIDGLIVQGIEAKRIIEESEGNNE